MAKPDCLWKCPDQWSAVEPMAVGRFACPESLEVAGDSGGHSAGQRPSHGNQLAASCWHQQRLRRLLLLSGGSWAQEQIDRHPTGAVGAAESAVARTLAACYRRFSHQAIRAVRRGGRHPSQSHAWACRPEVSVRSHLGHDFARPQASPMGGHGVAFASHAVRTPEDHTRHSWQPISRWAA